MPSEGWQGQVPRSWLAAAVRVMNTVLLTGMEIPFCSPAKGNKLQPCLARGPDTLWPFSSSSNHLSCKRNPAAHKAASIIFRDEAGSKSQQEKTSQKVTMGSQSPQHGGRTSLGQNCQPRHVQVH